MASRHDGKMYGLRRLKVNSTPLHEEEVAHPVTSIINGSQLRLVHIEQKFTVDERLITGFEANVYRLDGRPSSVRLTWHGLQNIQGKVVRNLPDPAIK